MRNVVIGFALLPERWTSSQKSLLHPEYPNSTLMEAEVEKSKVVYYVLHSDKDDKKTAGSIVASISSACIFYEEHWDGIIRNAKPEAPYSSNDRDDAVNDIMKCNCHADISVQKCTCMNNKNPNLFEKLLPVHILSCEHCQNPILVFSLDRAMGRKPEIVND